MMAGEFESRLQHVLHAHKWPYALKPLQIQALSYVYNKKHTLCLLPTGFGKSDLFALAGLIHDPVSKYLVGYSDLYKNV